MTWANEVNQIAKICDLQDVFARSNVKEIKGFFKELTHNDKELCIFSIQKAMGSATLYDFVRMIARDNAIEYIENENAEITKRWQDVLDKEADFNSTKQGLENKIKGLTEESEKLQYSNSRARMDNSEYLKRIMALESENEALQKDLMELRNFESHIKGLLTK